MPFYVFCGFIAGMAALGMLLVQSPSLARIYIFNIVKMREARNMYPSRVISYRECFSRKIRYQTIFDKFESSTNSASTAKRLSREMRRQKVVSTVTNRYEFLMLGAKWGRFEALHLRINHTPSSIMWSYLGSGTAKWNVKEWHYDVAWPQVKLIWNMYLIKQSTMTYLWNAFREAEPWFFWNERGVAGSQSVLRQSRRRRRIEIHHAEMSSSRRYDIHSSLKKYAQYPQPSEIL